MSNNKYFDFDLPQCLIDMIEEYKNDKNPLHVDLYQEEIRSLARYLDDEEQEDEVIDYFYRRGMRP